MQIRCKGFFLQFNTSFVTFVSFSIRGLLSGELVEFLFHVGSTLGFLKEFFVGCLFSSKIFRKPKLASCTLEYHFQILTEIGRRLIKSSKVFLRFNPRLCLVQSIKFSFNYQWSLSKKYHILLQKERSPNVQKYLLLSVCVSYDNEE